MDLRKPSISQENTNKMLIGIIKSEHMDKVKSATNSSRVHSFDFTKKDFIKTGTFIRNENLYVNENLYGKKNTKQGKKISENYLKQIERRTKSLDKREKIFAMSPLKKMTSVQDLIQSLKPSFATKKHILIKYRNFLFSQ